MHDSEHSDFKARTDLDQLNNSIKSMSFHMSMLRCTTHILGNAFWCKPNTDENYKSNPPKKELGFVDGCLGEKAALNDEAKGKFISKSNTMKRRKMGLRHLSDYLTGKTLRISKGHENHDTPVNIESDKMMRKNKMKELKK